MRLAILLALLLSGCVSTQCLDNPRSMACMSADEIQRELSQ